MAKENNDITDCVKKCKILLLDIEGTTTSISFVKDKLFPYAEENAKRFLESQWENEDVKKAVAALRKQAAEDQENSVDGLVTIPGEDATKDEQIEGLVNNLKWQMAADRKAGPLKQLQGLIWTLGYNMGDIKGHVYDDVFPALELWLSTEGQKVYIYSSGSVQAQKLLFNKSLAGDMLPLIEGHFDTAVGAKQEPASYAAIVEKIGCKAEEILFLTDIVKEAEAARSSGLHAALVSREGNAPLPTEAALFPILHSFEQLTLTNKRKPDPQAEEVPAKVLKTDASNDVKTESETESTKANGKTEPVDAMETAPVVENAEEPETMEVEETPNVVVPETKTPEVNEPVKETVVAEVPEIADKDVPMDEVVTDVPAAAELTPAETTVAMADSIETAETVTDKKVPEKNIAKEDDVTKVVLEAKPRVMMVDAATLTENVVVTVAPSESVEPSVTDNVDPVESKPTDAITEPTFIEKAAENSATEASVEESKIEETTAAEITAEVDPAIESTKSTTNVVVAEEAADGLAIESKDIEADSSIPDVVESNKKADITVDTNTEVTPTVDLKTEEAASVEPKPLESAADTAAGADAVETSDAIVIVAEIHESSIVSDPTEAIDAVVDESVTVTETTESVQNGQVAKLEKMVVEDVEEKVPDQKHPDDAQACVIEPAVKKIEEKTEPNETAMETDVAAVTAEKVETVPEPNDSDEKGQGAAQEAILSTFEVKDITDDKESLSEVADIIDDVVPIVEEPSELEEMDELQNAGDVLEKECDEILSKVQDVTNLDYMPVKPLHTITEEMETENIDTNDIVEGILDTEMELSMKGQDLDLNTVQEITEPKTDTDERIGKIEPGTEKPSETPMINDVAEEKMEVSSDAIIAAEKTNESIVEPGIDSAKEATLETVVEKMETEEVKVESVKQVDAVEQVEKEKVSVPQESKTDLELPVVVDPATRPDETEAKLENESDKASVAVAQKNGGSQDAKVDETTDTKLNGKSNSNEIVKLNGDACKEDDLKSRLTVEAVKEKVNGSNGSSAMTENVKADNVEVETPDIKVKTVAADDAHTPLERPVEA